MLLGEIAHSGAYATPLEGSKENRWLRLQARVTIAIGIQKTRTGISSPV
jgi:hypothetical protein